MLVTLFFFREIKMSPYDAELYDRYSSQVGSSRISWQWQHLKVAKMI